MGREVFSCSASDFNSVKVLKEVSETWWDLFFDVAWTWLKESGEEDEIQRPKLRIHKIVAENTSSARISSSRRGKDLVLGISEAQHMILLFVPRGYI